jgi:hypothetical protein
LKFLWATQDVDGLLALRELLLARPPVGTIHLLCHGSACLGGDSVLGWRSGPVEAAVLDLLGLSVTLSNSGGDTLKGSVHADKLDGDAGLDVIQGDGDNDLLIGGLRDAEVLRRAGTGSGGVLGPRIVLSSFGLSERAKFEVAGPYGRDELSPVEQLILSDSPALTHSFNPPNCHRHRR